MENIGGNNSFENNQYEVGENFKKLLDDCIDINKKIERGDMIDRLIDLLEHLDEYICNPNQNSINFVKENLGDQFDILVDRITMGYQEDIINYLKDKKSELEKIDKLENSTDILRTQEQILNAIEMALKSSGIGFSKELSLSQMEYLVTKPDECKNFISILKTIVKISKLPNVTKKPLQIQHLTTPINHIKVGFTGRMTQTKVENTKGHINLSNCVECNLSGSDRLIFDIENVESSNDFYTSKLDIKVLGKPPYKHD